MGAIYGQLSSMLLFFFVCNWGKHRSYAAAWLFWVVFLMLGAKTYPPVSLNLSSFGQESCGRKLCRDCDSDHTHPDKQRVAQHFFLLISRRRSKQRSSASRNEHHTYL